MSENTENSKKLEGRIKRCRVLKHVIQRFWI